MVRIIVGIIVSVGRGDTNPYTVRVDIVSSTKLIHDIADSSKPYKAKKISYLIPLWYPQAVQHLLKTVL